jgi:hypothetical protein
MAQQKNKNLEKGREFSSALGFYGTKSLRAD